MSTKSLSFEFTANTRQEAGKAATRRLRLTGQVPAIVYGDKTNPQSLTLKQNEVLKLISNEAVFSHILDLNIEGKKEKVVIKALVRHHTKPMIMHMDFLRVSASEKIHMQVPLHFINEEAAPGITEGGVASHLFSTLEITCLPKDLPESIDLDVSKLNNNETLHLSDIKLPTGVVLSGAALDDQHDLPVFSIHPPRVAQEEEETATTTDADTDADADTSSAESETEE